MRNFYLVAFGMIFDISLLISEQSKISRFIRRSTKVNNGITISNGNYSTTYNRKIINRSNKNSKFDLVE